MKKPQKIISEHENFKPMKMSLSHKIYDKYITLTCLYKTFCILFNLFQFMLFVLLNIIYKSSNDKILTLFFGSFVITHIGFIYVMIETYKLYFFEPIETKNGKIVILLSLILLIFYYLVLLIRLKYM